MWGYYVQQLICLVYRRYRNEEKFHLVSNLTYTNFIIETYLSITLVQFIRNSKIRTSNLLLFIRHFEFSVYFDFRVFSKSTKSKKRFRIQ